jgi:hypothetical protein
MKIVKSKDHNGHEWENLILESPEDVMTYNAINAQIASKQSWNFWKGFKTNTFRNTPLNYLVHENEGYEHGITLALAYQLELSPVTTSLVDYCHNADALINGIYKMMFRVHFKWKIR